MLATPETKPVRNRIKNLPFVGLDTNGELEYWTAEDNLPWAQGNALGREYAAALIDLMAELRAPSLLGYVLRAIAGKGRWGAVEIGFAAEIAERALRGR